MPVKNKKLMFVLFASAGFATALVVYMAMPKWMSGRSLALVVIRVDDVQDFAFRDAQLYLLRHDVETNVPTSLAVIANAFGSDKELVDTVKSAIQLRSELAVHGWMHEDLAKLSLKEQEMRLQNASEHLKEVLGIEATVLAPPMFRYDDDTLKAMKANGFTIVSGLAELQQPGAVSEGIVSIPATIELSDFENGTWQMKSIGAVTDELNESIRVYGYAAIVTHPQEFISNGTLNQEAISTYDELIQYVRLNYSFTTFEGLKDRFSFSQMLDSPIKSETTLILASVNNVRCSVDPIS